MAKYREKSEQKPSAPQPSPATGAAADRGGEYDDYSAPQQRRQPQRQHQGGNGAAKVAVVPET
jgi:hypothetical protein